MKDKSLKKIFRNTFIKILLISFILTIITFILWTIGFQNKLYPANYYERNIPEIHQKIVDYEGNLLDLDGKSFLESIIDLEGMDYQVVDKETRIIYGSTDKVLVEDKNQFMNFINRNLSSGYSEFTKIVPLLDENSEVAGGVLINYVIQPKMIDGKVSTKIFDLITRYLLFLPIIYIGILTIIYSRKISKELNESISILIDGADKIKNKDLDFTVRSESENEIGELSNAFEDMRIELKSSLERQWELENTRKENLSNIAHDLKTPLTIVNTYSESLIKNDSDVDRRQKYLQVINKNNQRAIDMIMDMNKLINIEDPNFKLNPIKIDILEFLESKEDDYLEIMNEYRIGYKYEIKDFRAEKEETLYDIEGINQIMDNIILNSIRFSEDKEIDIVIEIYHDSFIFKLSDTGPGFTGEDLANIFNKFYRGDKSRSSESGNSGLGMYISKEIVRLHGGEIKARNNKNGGAYIEFTVKEL